MPAARTRSSLRSVVQGPPGLRDPSLFRQQAFVAGNWVDVTASRALAVTNPATGDTIGHVPNLGRIDTRHAIESAALQFQNWRNSTAEEREERLLAYDRLIRENADDLARILTCEQGKPLRESLAEITYAASFVRWFAGEARRVYGDTVPAQPGCRTIVVKQPVGVCAAITPWNFPAAMVTRKIAPALAAGCTVVLKPSERTPFTALALCELAMRAGFPAGVLSCLTGDAVPIGDELTAHAAVRKISFTGSTRVGQLLMAQSAATVKRVSLELGGNAPFIVFDDADLDAAIAGVVAAKFRNAGQACIAANRILVQAGLHERFATRLAQVTASLPVGDGFDEASSIGPLIDEASVARMEALVRDATADGARVLTGGARLDGKGHFFTPTVLVDVTQSMAIAEAEIFGPVAPILRFDSEEEAIEIANATAAGLAAYVYSSDAARLWRLSSRIEAGMIGINESRLSDAASPFGGMKESGIGREGSRYGIDPYIEIKALRIDTEATSR